MDRNTTSTTEADGWPPVDVAFLALLFVGLAGFAFLMAVLTQFTGPTTDEWPPPRLVSGVLTGVVGLTLLGTGIGIYRRRRYGWIGGVVASLVAVAAYLWEGERAIPMVLLYVVVPLLVLVLLLLRRDEYLER